MKLFKDFGEICAKTTEYCSTEYEEEEDEGESLKDILMLVGTNKHKMLQLFRMLSMMFVHRPEWEQRIYNIIDGIKDTFLRITYDTDIILEDYNNILREYTTLILRLSVLYNFDCHKEYNKKHRKDTETKKIINRNRGEVKRMMLYNYTARTTFTDITKKINIDKLEIDIKNLLTEMSESRNKRMQHKLQIDLSEHIMSIVNYMETLSEIYEFISNDIEDIEFSECTLYTTFKKSDKMIAYLIKNGMLRHESVLYYMGLTSYNLLNMFENKCKARFATKSRKYCMGVADIREFVENNKEKIFDYIKKDDASEFISYVTQTNYPLKAMYIAEGMKYNKMYLSDIAAFYGAYNIWRYIVEKTQHYGNHPYECAIYGDNPEIIHYLEQHGVNMKHIDGILHLCSYCFKDDYYRYFVDYTDSWASKNMLYVSSNWKLLMDYIDEDYIMQAIMKDSQYDRDGFEDYIHDLYIKEYTL